MRAGKSAPDRGPAHPKGSLKRYRSKRDFTKTPEPSGDERPARASSAKKKIQKTLAFCVQKHLATALHYDFRLEFNGIMLSWAVPKGPSLNPRDKRLAMRVEDHPFDYRTFEGVIPSGYGAGVVMLWDEGTWQPEPGFENIAQALRNGELKFRLDAVKLKGSWVLVRTGAATENGEREKWLLIKHRDDWAGDIDITTAAPNSIRSERDFTGILKQDPDVWNSHQPGNPGDVRAELEQIVQKVMALEGGKRPAPAASKTRSAPPKKSRRK